MGPHNNLLYTTNPITHANIHSHNASSNLQRVKGYKQ